MLWQQAMASWTTPLSFNKLEEANFIHEVI
jgi:hypothetical protein